MFKNNCMKFPGIGIEKIFEEVKKKFSDSKIALLFPVILLKERS